MAGESGRLRAALADCYAIERELGAGGMATVYLAHDVEHHRQVALQVMRPELAPAAERFLREITIAANLQNPNILAVYGWRSTMSASTRLIVALLLVGRVALLDAQGTTGKIEGTVTDPNGAPVAGAQVMVRGTALGAVTSNRGYYFINNVPAGSYTMLAVYVGFQPNEVRNVRVLADQTLTVSIAMQAAVELRAITVTVEQNPIVPRDQVATKLIITGAAIQDLPVDDLRDIVNLQAGVVESERGLSLRGGRPGEAAVYVDGSLVRSNVWGTHQLVMGTNTLEEASVTTGAIGVEYGEAQSGIIGFVTRAGGPRLEGALSYETDEPFGTGASIGFNRVEASVGGPIAGALTFFAAGTLDGRQSNMMGKGFGDLPTWVLGGRDTAVSVAGDEGSARTVEIPRFLQFGGTCDASENFGYDCQGLRRPYNWSTTGTGQAKLQYTYAGGSRLSATYLQSRTQGREWDYATAFAPQLTRGRRLDSRMAVFNWTQQVTSGVERSLAFDVTLSYQADREVRGALDPAAVADSRSPFGGWSLARLPFVVDFDHFSDDTPAMYGGVDSLTVTRLESGRDWDQLIYNVRTNQGTRVPYLNRNDLRNTQEFRMNPWAQATGFFTEGVATNIRLLQEDRYVGRAFLDWQIDRYSRVRLGGDAQVSRVNLVSSGLLTQDWQDAFAEQPVRYALFGEERLDLGDLVIDLGVRWDYFDTGAYFQVSPGYTYGHPRFDPLDPLDPSDSVFARGEGHSRLSPRVRVSFPVTDRTGFRLSYAHQVQSPDYWTSLTFINTNGHGGRDVTFGRTILFEFGIRHAFSPDFVFDLSAYNKDKVSDLATRQVQFTDPRDTTGGTLYFAPMVTNADFGNVRGLDVNLLRRIGNIVNAQLAYTLQVARSTGADPWSSWGAISSGLDALTGLPPDPPQATFETDDNRIHTFAGALAVTLPGSLGPGTWYGPILRDAGAFLRLRLASGVPYTPLENSGSGRLGPYMGYVANSEIMEGATNSARMPWTREVDLRVTKGLRVGRTQWTLFADIRNLINVGDLRWIFAETGGPVNARHRAVETEPEVMRLQSEAGAFANTEPDGSIVIRLPPDCGQWEGGPVNCVLIKRAEARFGDGDGVYTEAEYRTAFNAAYDQARGTFYFYAPPRHTRLGVELRF